MGQYGKARGWQLPTISLQMTPLEWSDQKNKVMSTFDSPSKPENMPENKIKLKDVSFLKFIYANVQKTVSKKSLRFD